ncbi:hypothetical protein DL93DRAFT_2082523 [Clavulina sp. PMI_390]|nr:hypothetical protein DL93DRAFT_2082523 [Clavulina sp. PMI_390]
MFLTSSITAPFALLFCIVFALSPRTISASQSTMASILLYSPPSLSSSPPFRLPLFGKNLMLNP